MLLSRDETSSICEEAWRYVFPHEMTGAQVIGITTPADDVDSYCTVFTVMSRSLIFTIIIVIIVITTHTHTHNIIFLPHPIQFLLSTSQSD